MRHGIAKDWADYPHTRVNVELERAIHRALELHAFLEGVPYKRYLRVPKTHSLKRARRRARFSGRRNWAHYCFSACSGKHSTGIAIEATPNIQRKSSSSTLSSAVGGC